MSKYLIPAAISSVTFAASARASVGDYVPKMVSVNGGTAWIRSGVPWTLLLPASSGMRWFICTGQADATNISDHQVNTGAVCLAL